MFLQGCVPVYQELLPEAQLSQRDRATRCVYWNLISCCTAIRKVTFATISLRIIVRLLVLSQLQNYCSAVLTLVTTSYFLRYICTNYKHVSVICKHVDISTADTKYIHKEQQWTQYYIRYTHGSNTDKNWKLKYAGMVHN